MVHKMGINKKYYEENDVKKICYIVTIPETIEAFFISQLVYLSENGFEVTVICSKVNRLQEKLIGIRCISVDIPRGISFAKMVSAIKKLYFIFIKERFDIIQYSTPNAALCAAIAGWLSRIKSRNYHIMGFRYLGERNIVKEFLKLLEKLTCVLSTSIECVSKSNLELGIREHIFSKTKAVLIWNGSSGGVDLVKFNYANRDKYREEIREKYYINSTEFVFGFVGRITKDKGINEILEAYGKINSGKLFLIGNIEDGNSLDNTLYKKSIENDNIIYTGAVSQVEKYYAAIDVLLLPSYREGFGNVIIEAGAMGTPAIISNIPGPVDAVIANRTALIVPAKDADSLCRAMKKIMHLDYKLMGDEARAFIENNFSSQKLNQYILERKCNLFNN